MIEFAKAEPQDAQAIHTLFVACGKDLLTRGMDHWANAPTVEQIRSDIEHGDVWVARLDDDVVATWTQHDDPHDDGGFWSRDDAGAVYVKGLGVHPAHQHQGLGLRCGHFIERTARAAGATRLRFDASAKDERLIAIYREFGSVEVGRSADGSRLYFEDRL